MPDILNIMIPDSISCGGVVYRRNNNGEIEIVLLHRFKSASWQYDSWHLPKGTQILSETQEQTALREIQEETGFKVNIVQKLGELRSTYEKDGKTKNKLTHYFLCKPLGQVGTHDYEHDEVVWVEIDHAIALVSQFPVWEKEEDILTKAIKDITSLKV